MPGSLLGPLSLLRQWRGVLGVLQLLLPALHPQPSSSAKVRVC